MNVCILYYDEFWGYEVGLALNELRNENIFSVALEDRVYVSEAKQKFMPDKTIEELNPDEIDLFLIPGGDTKHLYDNVKLRNFVRVLNAKNKFIAGICGGTVLMASYGMLEGRRCTGAGEGLKSHLECMPLFKKSTILNKDVVVDGNIITSTGQGFIEFAVELGRVMKVFKSEEEAMAEYRWLKNTKS
ncbi:DJ-1/PfpI family protein [Clostridium sp. YIM B02515]|uniref:DJ-1/PfpI family protein n=1 Tax=Clostridium rhizosphaerae TaxID=2803861 RepID=A0ABS1TIH7_9CLOT|nr:DJ-1/PfpI family protein [Clostridium rhizosphaerae]MBL4937763.1 DJ-1/PfpI family protein [Clostridium rhizosphaerae]